MSNLNFGKNTGKQSNTIQGVPIIFTVLKTKLEEKKAAWHTDGEADRYLHMCGTYTINGKTMETKDGGVAEKFPLKLDLGRDGGATKRKGLDDGLFRDMYYLINPNAEEIIPEIGSGEWLEKVWNDSEKKFEKELVACKTMPEFEGKQFVIYIAKKWDVDSKAINVTNFEKVGRISDEELKRETEADTRIRESSTVWVDRYYDETGAFIPQYKKDKIMAVYSAEEDTMMKSVQELKSEKEAKEYLKMEDRLGYELTQTNPAVQINQMIKQIIYKTRTKNEKRKIKEEDAIEIIRYMADAAVAIFGTIETNKYHKAVNDYSEYLGDLVQPF